MANLPITNVINISVAQTQVGANNYNTSNLALFTSETPGGGFGSLGYKLYEEPNEVATDFGSSSITAQQANAVFSQQPNILAGGGQLIVIPFLSLETLAAAITRTISLVSYFGIITTQIESQSDMLAAAAVVQANNLICFFVADSAGAIAPGGQLDLLRSGSFSQSRGLIYLDSSSAGLHALLYRAAYAGRALSVNFFGSNTTLTMNLKQLAGIQPDPGMTQTYYTEALAAGADSYPSLQGVPGVICSGANQFFDLVYNTQWFVGALQIAGFNYLAGAATKVPQTESGMDGLKSAYQQVCDQGVNNQFLAPGTWTSPVTFGNQGKFYSNIANFGYYIYSQPIAQQNAAARAARQAPLVQIAVKTAGAIQTSDVIVFVNP